MKGSLGEYRKCVLGIPNDKLHSLSAKFVCLFDGEGEGSVRTTSTDGCSDSFYNPRDDPRTSRKGLNLGAVR